MLSSPRLWSNPAVVVRNALLVVAVIGLGVAAEWVGYGFSEPIQWVPDLATGWALAGAGLVAWSRRPASLVGPLLLASGVAWFAGGFARPAEVAVVTLLGVGPASWVTAVLFVAHRAPLAHAILTYPAGHATSVVERAAVAGAYASVALPIVWQTPTMVAVTASALALVTYRSYRLAIGPVRRARRHAARVAGVVASALVAGAIVRVLDQAGQWQEASILVYDLAVMGVGIALGGGLLRYQAPDPAFVDFVVELGQTQGGPLRDALAEALGDPSLQVGYWIGERSAYVDVAGRKVEMPGSGGTRAETRIDREGMPIAVLIHDRSVLGDPALVDAVAAAAQLGSRNVRLQAEVARQLVDLQDSRRRLIESGDAERGRLEQRLREGARRRLEKLGADIDSTNIVVDPPSESGDRIERARYMLAKTMSDLRDLADGLHPAELRAAGLAGALEKLAGRSPTPVELEVNAPALPGTVEAAVYFLCAEAIANTVKHARASKIIVTITQAPTRVTLSVVDDGHGGADPRRGTGLLGLADRVEALGGQFAVQSAAGRGTRLTAEIPLVGEAAR